MRNQIIRPGTFVLFVSTIIQSRGVNADGQQINEGEMPYTPTRIEWLIAKDRNECGFWLDGFPGVSFGLFNINGPNKKNTITLSVLFKDEFPEVEFKRGHRLRYCAWRDFHPKRSFLEASLADNLV